MNTGSLARHYDRLTPEERFRLILAASGRGDEAERDRLGRAAPRITLGLQEHWPYAQAFTELSWLIFIELAENATRFRDAVESAFAECGSCDACTRKATGGGGRQKNRKKGARVAEPPEGGDDPPGCQRYAGLAGVAAFVLRVKSDGWNLFCSRLGVPPSLLWEELPGLARLMRDLASAEQAALSPEGFLQWMNRVRCRAGDPEATTVTLTAERIADETELMFRAHVRSWGG